MAGRKGLVMGLGLALAGLVSTSAAAQTKAPAAFGSLVSQIVAFFPALTGEIVEAKGSELIVSVGRREGVQVGMEFFLFRDGRELRHPKTGEVLGRVEQALGLAVVSQISETYSVATVASDGGVRPGDRVRISEGKINLTVTALGSPGVSSGVVDAVSNALSEELSATGRFQVINGDGVAAVVAHAGIPPERVIQGEGLAEPAARYRVSHLLVVWVKQVQAKPFVETRLFSFLPGREATPMMTASLFVPSAVKAASATAAGEQFSSAPPQSSTSPPPQEAPQPSSRSFLARLLFGEETTQPELGGTIAMPFSEVARFGFPVLAMDVAVSPKDQIPRLVVTDGERIYLFRIAGRTLEREWTYVAEGAGEIFSVQLADLNDDGVLEIVANRYSPLANAALTSFIVTSKDGNPSLLVQDLFQILFAVDATGDGVKRTLWVQRFNFEGFFAQGQVQRYSLRNGTLVPESSVRVPRDFRATGATLCNILGDGPRALAYVNERNRLVIATEGKEKWRSSSRVGGGGYVQLEVQKKIERAGGSLFYSVEPMALAVDLDGDGIDEVLIPQNEVQGNLAVVSRSPAGYRLQTLNTGLEETVTGLGAIRGDGAPTVILASVQFWSLLKKSGETRILMTAPK